MLDHGFRGSSSLSPKQGYGKQNTMMGKTLQVKTAHLVEPGKQKLGPGQAILPRHFLGWILQNRPYCPQFQYLPEIYLNLISSQD